MVNTKLLEKHYKNKKVIIKKQDSSNDVYGIIVGVDQVYVYVDKALFKPMDANGHFSQHMHDELASMDKYKAIDEYGNRFLTINHQSIDSIEVLLSRDEREKNLERMVKLSKADRKL